MENFDKKFEYWLDDGKSQRVLLTNLRQLFCPPWRSMQRTEFKEIQVKTEIIHEESEKVENDDRNKILPVSH